MSALIVQSRFAGLKIEDDDSSSTEASQKINKTKPTNNGKKPELPKKAKTNNTKTQSSSKKKKSKQVAMSAEQWEQWKQKDKELTDGNFEDELHQAILLSKLDYEEKKGVYDKCKKDADKERKLLEEQQQLAAKGKKKQQKKKNVMSLEQFNDMLNGEDTKFSPEVDKESEDNKSDDTEFFERVKEETKNELMKDKIIDRSRNRLVTDEIITRGQFLDTLERKDNEIAALREEVISLKAELITVKTRNKKLCNILGQGEMKDKAEVLWEVDRLRSVQAELTTELASLHRDLEKERSRHTDLRAKDKKSASKKKNIRFDVSSEAIFTKESGSGTAG